MQSDRTLLLIEDERLDVVFRYAPLTLTVGTLNALLTAWMLTPAGQNLGPAMWVFAIGLVALVRAAAGRVFLQQPAGHRNIRRWTAISVSGAFATGSLWGAGTPIFFPTEASLQLFLSFVIGGMCAGAAAVNAVHFPTVAAFILPATVPLVAVFLTSGPTGPVSALMILVFAFSLSLIGLCGHRAFGERMRLQLELREGQKKLQAANADLGKEIAQRRSAEANLHQAQKMEAIGRLTGGIAHDFNNLLQVVIGNINLIRRLAGDNQRIAAYAQAAEQAALRGGELTGSLLSFARRQSLKAERVDINQLLREFEPILLRTLGSNIQFEIALAADLPACQTDPAHFQSAVLNLVINARDAMPNGGRLSVATGRATLASADLIGNPDASPGDFVRISVQDTGSGMTDALKARVFEPFFTTKDEGKGTGLGLSQVFGFARQLSGHIVLETRVGEGTKATLWLPVADPRADTSAGPSAHSSPVAATLAGNPISCDPGDQR